MKGSPFYTPAIGIRFPGWIRFLRVFSPRRIRVRYWPRLLGTGLISLACWPFQKYEDFRLRARLDALELHDEPVFIIGHWRSGTTHLHSIMSRDEQFGFVTTLQGVFPHSFQANVVFPKVMSWLMPGTRPMDDVRISLSSPQEEEIALMAYGPYSLYHLWHFPDQARRMYRRFVEFEGMDTRARAVWEEMYRDLLKRAALYLGKDRLVLKNPANTGRIPTLLKLFPNGRFIHIHRDPLEVYGSTKKLYSKVLPLFSLQDLDLERMNRDVVFMYKNMMEKYVSDKELIPEGQLVEVAFSELVNRPMQVIERIYGALDLGGFETAAPKFEAYLNEQRAFKKSEYSFSKDEEAMLHRELQDAIDRWSEN